MLSNHLTPGGYVPLILQQHCIERDCKSLDLFYIQGLYLWEKILGSDGNDYVSSFWSYHFTPMTLHELAFNRLVFLFAPCFTIISVNCHLSAWKSVQLGIKTVYVLDCSSNFILFLICINMIISLLLLLLCNRSMELIFFNNKDPQKLAS